jgi:formate/nitrite transporter FocA (FNT family)
VGGAPEPEEIFERTREEGERRLTRPFLELVTTSFAAGFDILAGLVILGLLIAQTEHQWGTHVAHVIGSIGFGAAFAFLVVGRGELFTENFLVPLAALDHRRRHTWLKLGELWTISPMGNILGGSVLAIIVSVHSVLPYGTGQAIARTAEHLHANGWLALFCSAIFAGGLMTAMTWFVEGQDSVLVRVVIAWAIGVVIALGYFNHVIVETIELIFGIRYGAPIPWRFVVENFFLAAGGNMLGGIGLVTLIRFTQAKAEPQTSA